MELVRATLPIIVVLLMTHSVEDPGRCFDVRHRYKKRYHQILNLAPTTPPSSPLRSYLRYFKSHPLLSPVILSSTSPDISATTQIIQRERDTLLLPTRLILPNLHSLHPFCYFGLGESRCPHAHWTVIAPPLNTSARARSLAWASPSL